MPENRAATRLSTGQNLLLSGLYRLTPGLTVSATDVFVASNYTNIVAAQGISTGRHPGETPSVPA
jgi:hypothetical protein